MNEVACTIDWTAFAAWVQAVFSVIAIGVAIWLPKRDRKNQRDEDFATQKAALISIAKRGQKTIERLQRRAANRALPRHEIGWLRDEAAATSSLADSVDLTTLRASSLVDAFVELQEACRTASRRLKRDVAKAPDGGASIPLENERFDDPAQRAQRSLDALAAATQSAP